MSVSVLCVYLCVCMCMCSDYPYSILYLILFSYGGIHGYLDSIGFCEEEQENLKKILLID